MKECVNYNLYYISVNTHLYESLYMRAFKRNMIFETVYLTARVHVYLFQNLLELRYFDSRSLNCIVVCTYVYTYALLMIFGVDGYTAMTAQSQVLNTFPFFFSPDFQIF